MTRDVLLAIDAGGSYVKATTFDLTTSESHTVGEPVGLSRSAPGFNERDADGLWRATVRCVQGCLQRLDGGAGRVAAVGITGHGNGVYLVDDRGMPSRSAIMASDGRAASLVRGWVAEGVEDRLRPAAWNGLWAGKPGPILAWLAAHEPDTLAASHAVLGCKDYLRARLTGEVHTELSDASAGGLYDNSALISRPDAVLHPATATLDELGLGAHAHLLLPAIDPMTTFAVSGEAALETGLTAGTVVVAGVVDNAAMQHGSGIFDSSAICVGAGTWSINQLLVPLTDMTMDGALGAVLPSAANAALGGYGLLCEASATSASSFAWALETAVTGESSADRSAGRDIFAAALKREGSRPRRPDDPMFFPYIDGSREEAAARGAWLGLSSAATEGDLLGAVLEGICLEHRRHVD
ncbi:MAG: FGGY family carbohydrate kinase, partial [Propionibacteriaceae bacterium]|nr:FGGY family carbohydrate kinase [Propionibacteriaceae bacterium]